MESLWMLLPLLTDVLVGGQALKRFEPFGKVVGQQECGEMLAELRMRVVVITMHSRIFNCTVHAFHLPIGPRMVQLGQPMLNAMLQADAVKEVEEGVPLPLLVRKLDAVVSQNGMDAVGYGRNQAAQEVTGDGAGHLWMQLRHDELGGAVDGHKQVELAFCRADLRDVQVKVADGVSLELGPLGRRLPDVG